jgi:hypothetical protein
MRACIVALALVWIAGSAAAQPAKRSPIWAQHDVFDCVTTDELERKGKPVHIRFDLAQGAACVRDGGVCTRSIKLIGAPRAPQYSGLMVYGRTEDGSWAIDARDDGIYRITLSEKGWRLVDFAKCQAPAG